MRIEALTRRVLGTQLGTSRHTWVVCLGTGTHTLSAPCGSSELA